MRHSLGITVAVGIGLIAVAAPILISAELAWREGLANERALSLGYSSDVLRRTDEMGQEMLAASNRILDAHFAPCSKPDVDLMRRIDVGSTYIQAVGRIAGDTMTCTSLGTTQPIELGPPAFLTENQSAIRLDVHLRISDSPLLIVSRNGLAFLLNPQIPVDTPTEGPNISMAVFAPSAGVRGIIASRNPRPLRQEWFRTVAPGTRVTFRSGGYVIAIDRSSFGDVAVLTAAPESYVIQHVRQFALIFIPFGLIGAALFAWAVAHITRLQLSLPAQLRAAARRREFFLEYQPIVDLETRRCIGAEALVRWHCRDGRIIYPSDFIDIAEDSGVIQQITARVTEIVALDLPSLLAVSSDFSVSINLSASDMRSAHTVALIHGLLQDSNAQPRNIKLEATEHGFLQGKEAADILSQLRALGVQVAIDDFGTGYSNLSRLQTIGADILKIDKEFMDAATRASDSAKIVDHVIGMAQSLHLVAVAEGVETEAQAQFLRQRGVRFAQGWLFAKPMRIGLLRTLLDAQESTANKMRA